MEDLMEKIVSLTKRRGFIFPSSEIYGGLNSCWDYGPLGVLLKNNVKKAWWKSTVQQNEMVVGLDASILMHPKVWEASGHVSSFSDPLVECKKCHERFREDHLAEGRYGDVMGPDGKVRCPKCKGELTESRKFNLMFKTFLGSVEDSASTVYLRPETAQGIFVDFKQVQETTRAKIPFGIAQIGKAFRNEITPGNFTFRTREFEQMEIEFFVKPGTDEKWHKYWLDERLKWYKGLGIKKENLRLRQHSKDELSHYSKATFDIEYKFPWGWGELEGIANRTNFDLTQHSKFSGKDLSYFDEAEKKSYKPFVIEPSAGADRATLAFLLDAYLEEKDKDETRVVLKLNPALSPKKIAVLPLTRDEKLVNLAKELYKNLSKSWFVAYDEVASIGRRYRRGDEIGIPFAVTVDFDTLTDKKVTVRDRDSMKQDRIETSKLQSYFFERLGC